MTTPAKYDFTVRCNETFSSDWTIKSSGLVQDITNIDFKLQVKQKKGSAVVAVKTLTVGSGLTKVDAVNGVLRISFAGDTSVTSTQTYVYDLVATVVGVPSVWVEGIIRFEP